MKCAHCGKHVSATEEEARTPGAQAICGECYKAAITPPGQLVYCDLCIAGYSPPCEMHVLEVGLRIPRKVCPECADKIRYGDTTTCEAKDEQR